MEWNEDETAQFELENIEAEKLTYFISPLSEKIKQSDLFSKKKWRWN